MKSSLPEILSNGISRTECRVESREKCVPPLLVLLTTAEECLFFLTISSISNVIAGIYRIRILATFELRSIIISEIRLFNKSFFSSIVPLSKSDFKFKKNRAIC
jgi:hypothetical protein